MKKTARAKRISARTRRAVPRKKKTTAEPAVTVNRSAVPYLIARDCARAIDFYKRAFGAVETVRLADPSGKIAHCEIKIGDAVIFLADEWEGIGAKSPSALGGCPVIIHLEVDDVDWIARRAIDAGAKVIFPVQDQFYGARSGRLQDPLGHMWLLSMNIEKVSDREMRRREQAWLKENAQK